jgi:hypothetical protein
MSPDLLDEPQQATKISESKAAELYSRLSRPKKKEKEEERARTPPPSLAPNQTWRPSTATTDDETAEEREEREAREARDAQERQAELERRREAIERLHAPRTRKKDDISEGVAADSQVLSSLGLRTDLRGRLEADEDLPKMFPDPGRIRLLAQPKKEKKREEAPVAPGPEPDFVEGKRRRPDGGAEPEAEAKPRRSLDVQRMDAMAKPVKPRPKSAERQPPKSEVIVEPLVAYSENLPHRLNPAKPRAVPVPQPAKVTREEQQAQVRRLATRKEKHALEELREEWRQEASCDGSAIVEGATELVAEGDVSVELRSYFEEVIWTALSLAREFGAVPELAETVGWCRPDASGGRLLVPTPFVQSRIDAEFPALGDELAKWRIPEDEAEAISRLRKGRDALLRLAQRARKPRAPRLQRVDEEPRRSISHWSPDLEEVRTPPKTGAVGAAKGR